MDVNGLNRSGAPVALRGLQRSGAIWLQHMLLRTRNKPRIKSFPSRREMEDPGGRGQGEGGTPSAADRRKTYPW